MVFQYLEHAASSLLAEHGDAIRAHVGGSHGVYALYKRQRLYYVGLATDLRVRLKQHLKDRHEGRWDNFSIYLTLDSAFMKEWWNVPGLDPRIQYHMRRESARIPADIWRAMLDQGEVARDLRVTAPRISAPTLLLFGGKDALFSAEDNQDMARWLPHAKVVTLTDLGHSLPEEDPEAVVAALRRFLQ